MSVAPRFSGTDGLCPVLSVKKNISRHAAKTATKTRTLRRSGVA